MQAVSLSEMSRAVVYHSAVVGATRGLGWASLSSDAPHFSVSLNKLRTSGVRNLRTCCPLQACPALLCCRHQQVSMTGRARVCAKWVPLMVLAVIADGTAEWREHHASQEEGD
jgi:hypothetical protein